MDYIVNDSNRRYDARALVPCTQTHCVPGCDASDQGTYQCAPINS